MQKFPEQTELTVVGWESVTITLNSSGLFDMSDVNVVQVKVFVVEETLLNSMFAVIEPVTVFDISQLQVYGLVPPDTVAVHDTVCPTSSFVDDGQFESVGVVGGVYAAITVRVPDFTELVVSGVVALSVNITFACSVFPASADGITHAKLLVVPVTPVNSMFATRFPVIVFTIRQFTVYVEVPPVQLAVKVIVLPAFWVDGRTGEDVRVGIPRVGFTVTSLFIELVVSAVVALSVTNMQQYKVDDGVTAVNVADPEVNEDWVWTKVDPVLHVDVADEYSLAVQSGVPPDQVDEKVTGCPLSIVGLDGLIVGTDNAVFTVIVTPDEQADVAVVAESVTWYAYVLVEVGAAEQVEAVAPEIEFAEVHVGAVVPVIVYHWYVYDGVPPDGCDVRVVDWPESITVFVAVGVPADSAAFNVMVPDFTEFSVSADVAESVTITFVCTVLPASALGKAHVKLLDVDDTPVYNAFVISAPVTELTVIQLYVYGEVPPDTVVEKVTDCPQSYDCAAVGEIVGILRVGLTVTSLFIELAVDGDVALSDTNMQQYKVDDGVTAVNVALPDVRDDWVWTKVDPVLHVLVVDEYSLAVQSGVPPDHVLLKVTGCPLSIVGLDGLIVGTDNAAATQKFPEQILFTVVGCESVTITLNSSGLLDMSEVSVVQMKVFDVEETLLNSMFAVIEPVIVFDISQLQVYGEVPPDTVAVHDTVCPTSSFVDDGHDESAGVVGVVYAAITVIVPDSTELVVSEGEAESVTITLA